MLMSIIRDLKPPPGVVRVLAASNLARTIGQGFVVAASVLFFTRSVGIGAADVAFGLAIASAAGMAVSVLGGHAADVLGPRRMAMVFISIQGLAISGYVVVGGFVSFVVAASVVMMADASGNAARGAVIAAAIPAEHRVASRAYLRSVTNIGLSFGILLGGVALASNHRTMYVVMLLASGCLFIAAALIYLLAPPVPTVARPPKEERRSILSDRPILVIAVLNAVLVMNDGLLTVALPLWIVERTEAPPATYAGLLVVNTIMVVLFQVRVSRGAEDVPSGAKAMRRAGVLFAICCGIFALAAGQPMWIALVCLAAGTLVHVVGELLYAAGQWALSFGLAPEHAQGQYQGLFGLTTKLGSTLAPAITAVLILGWGWPGWLLFGASLLLAGICVPPMARWALRTRERESEPATIAA
ncbi:MFS transporter [Stackebrandtia soli]|uniref:MFS transporter n=1 Tax=Stackebrandtia soli TaxID=1892856 RepID=UPI0039E827CE